VRVIAASVGASRERERATSAAVPVAGISSIATR
jgi:hypothetical protein